MKLGKFSNSILPFIPSDQKKLYLFTVLFAISLQIFSIILLFFDVPFSRILIIVIGFPLLLFILSSVEKFFIFIILYLSLTPLQTYCNMYIGFPPIGVKRKYLYVLYCILLVYWIFSLILKKKKIKIGVLGYSIIFYTCIAFFGLLLGFINANKNLMNLNQNEFIPQLMYLSFFVFMTTKLKEKNIRLFFDFILIISFIIGLQFIYAFPQNSITVFTRIPTINVHISLLAVPYVLGILFYSKSMKRKVISMIALVPICFAFLISLQRSLWLAIGVVFIISLFIYFLQKGYSFMKIIFILFAVLLSFMVILSAAIFALIKISSGSATLVLLKRLLSFTNIVYLKVDLSAFERFYEIKQAFSKIIGIQWLIGRGMGDTIFSRARFTTMHYLDNSYAWIIWKMGIIGLISFLTMFGIFFQRAIFLFRKCICQEDRIYVLTIFLNILGLMIVGLANSCLVQYRFIIIWALSMAIMETIYLKYKNENTVNLFK